MYLNVNVSNQNNIFDEIIMIRETDYIYVTDCSVTLRLELSFCNN